MDTLDIFASVEQKAEAMRPTNKAQPWALLDLWQEHGWIRALDLALARMLNELDESASLPVLLGVVFASHQLGRGHICLDLAATLKDPDSVLSLPPEGEMGERLPGRPSEVLSQLSLEAWSRALKESALVTTVRDHSATCADSAPLVLDQGLLYLRRQWHYEVAVAAQISQRVQAQTGRVNGDDVKALLAQLFDSQAAVSHAVQPDWQQVACALAALRGFSIITGGPGTGKTTTVVRLLALLQSLARHENRVLRIRLAAPTGKAAARLTESISNAVSKLPAELQTDVPSQVTTLHRLLGSRPDTRKFIHNRQKPLHADLVVVDEASMIDLEMMHALLEALPAHARLILLGDKDQLASVEAGAVLGDLCLDAQKGGYSTTTLDQLAQLTGQDIGQWQQEKGEASDSTLAQTIVMLRHSHRFDANSGIGQLADLVNQGRADDALTLLRQRSGEVGSDLGLELFRSAAPDALDSASIQRLILKGNGAVGGYRHYLEQLDQLRPHTGNYTDPQYQEWGHHILNLFADFRLLCALRRGFWGIEGVNQLCERVLEKHKLIEVRGQWYEGRPVMVTRNDYALGLMNGDIGITLRVVEPDGATALRVVFPLSTGELKWVLPSRLLAVETVFAMTVHKSQGSEFTHTVMILPPTPNPVMTRELVYTGITRASRFFTLVCGDSRRFSEALQTPVRRASALRRRLLSIDAKAGHSA